MFSKLFKTLQSNSVTNLWLKYKQYSKHFERPKHKLSKTSKFVLGLLTSN